MRAQGNGWVVFQPSDDEDEAVCLRLRGDMWWTVKLSGQRYAQRTFTQPEALKLYDALGDALGNMQPPYEDSGEPLGTDSEGLPL